MDIHRFSSCPFNVNSYIIEENGHLLMVDPILTAEVCKIIEKKTVDYAILTHEHYDHILSVNEINGNNLFPVHCGQATALAINDPRKNLSRYSEFLLEFIPFVDKAKKITIKDYTCECHDILHDSQSLSWQNHDLFIKETPGHSKGSICILLDGKYLFSGDSLFKSFETAVRLPGGSAKDYRGITLEWIKSLPPDTMIYPGHLEPFPLKERYPFGYEEK